MYQTSDLFFLYAESPIHVGSGSNIEGIDLPVQRETHTGLPMLASSGIKGGLRDRLDPGRPVVTDRATATDADEEKKRAFDKWYAFIRVFGPEAGDEVKFASALAFTDARLLLFPVRSVRGTFAWTVSPFVLQRLLRDLSVNHELEGPPDEVFQLRPSQTEALVGTSANRPLALNDQIILEDDCLSQVQDAAIDKLAAWLARTAFAGMHEYWRDRIGTHLVMVHDDIFEHFTSHATEVMTRNKIGETGTVERGMLWDEESLPSDTLLYTIPLATFPSRTEVPLVANKYDVRTPEQVLEHVRTELDLGNESALVQLGGKATIGRGLLRVSSLVATLSDGRRGQANRRPEELPEDGSDNTGETASDTKEEST